MLSRSSRFFALLILALHSPAPGRALDSTVFMYVGTYTGEGSKGIYVYRCDAATGEVHSQGLGVKTENPSFLTSDSTGRFLYAVNEIESFHGQAAGAVSVFSIEPETGKLRLIQQVSSLGKGPAHLSLDRSGHFLMVANYGGGSVAVFPVAPDGRVGRHTAFMQAHGSSVNRARQESPHAHCVQTTPDNRLALVADLGIDKLLVYRFDEKAGLLAIDSGRTRNLKPGAGPRHIAITPGGKDIYVANELSSTVTHFSYEASEGRLDPRETVSTLSPGFTGTNAAAEIIVDGGGKNLYVSNRGDDSIVQFSIDPSNGRLQWIDRVSCGGKTPRHIAIDPSGKWMFSSNQNSNTITLFRVDPVSGRLQTTGRSIKIVAPVCVVFVSHDGSARTRQ